MLFSFRSIHTDILTVRLSRLSSVLVEEPLRDNPVVTSVGFVGNATAHLSSKLSDDIQSGHHGPEVKVILAKSRTYILSVSTEICAGRVPSAPVPIVGVPPGECTALTHGMGPMTKLSDLQ